MLVKIRRTPLSVDPSGTLMSFERGIGDLLEDFFRDSLRDDNSFAPTHWAPAVDIAEHENEYVVRAELPGVSKDEVKITVHREGEAFEEEAEKTTEAVKAAKPAESATTAEA